MHNKQRYVTLAGVALIMALTTVGCATRKYARAQANVVNQRVAALETKTNQQVSYITQKHISDISRVDERITSTDNKLAEVSNTAQQASASAAQAGAAASQAAQQAQENSSQIAASNTEINKVQKSLDYTVVETGNVTFGFNKYDLTDDAKVALDLMAQKALTNQRIVLEVTGFTDTVGSKTYNETLARRRAESVARYLIKQNIAPKNITIVGMGAEQTPEMLAAEVQAVDPNATDKQLKAMARRARIRLYAPEGSGAANSSSGSGAAGTPAAQLH